jgi:hypothetical protein
MDELLEYDEPPPRPKKSPQPAAPAQQRSPQPAAPAQQRSPQPAAPTQQRAKPSVAINTTNKDSDDDEDNHVTLQELYDAAQILAENNKAITSENLLTIITASRQVKSEIQRALLLRRMQEVLAQSRREREVRERQAAQQAQAIQQARAAQQAQVAGELLLLSWLFQ